jgi:hypothetical protein
MDKGSKAQGSKLKTKAQETNPIDLFLGYKRDPGLFHPTPSGTHGFHE